MFPTEKIIELNQDHCISQSQYSSGCCRPISVGGSQNCLRISKPIFVVAGDDLHVVFSLDIKLSFLFCSFTNKGKEKRLRFKNRTGERGKLSLCLTVINIMSKVLMEN